MPKINSMALQRPGMPGRMPAPQGMMGGNAPAPADALRPMPGGMKKGGKVKSASSRADGIAQRGKTRGTMVMCGGGMTSMGSVKTAAPSRDGVVVKGKTKGKQIVMAGNKGMKKGGYC